MSRIINQQRGNREWWAMAGCSSLLHLAVYFFIISFHFSTHLKEAPVYYVDVVNLPVANPQAGSSNQTGGSPAPPPPPIATQPREMSLPSKPLVQAPVKQTPVKQAPIMPPKPSKPAETSAEEFEAQMARREQEAEARHQASAMEALKRRANGTGPVGMPGASGTEAGSDYASYIRSRLEDAFRREDTFKPEPGKMVIVLLTIDRNGRIISQRYEQRSNDPMFDAAVVRAITRAEKEFKRPPGGGTFESRFVFKPQGVGKK